MTRRSRLTPTQLAQVASSLGDRERQIIETVGRLRLVTGSQIQRLHFVDGSPPSRARRARQALLRLTKRRALTRLDRRIGGVRAGSAGYIYSLDVVGQHVAGVLDGRKRRPAEPGFPYIAHRLDVTELYVRLKEAGREGPVDLIEFSAEPDCWRHFYGHGGARIVLKPDAFVRIARGHFEDLWFIEVDRATQSQPALQRKFRLYRQYWGSGREQARWDGVFPRILCLAPSVTRLRKLIDVAGAQPPESWQLFTVRLYDEAVDVMTAEETS